MGYGSFDVNAVRKREGEARQRPHQASAPVEPDQVQALVNLKKRRLSLVTAEHPKPLPIAALFDVTGSMQTAHKEMTRGGTTHLLEILLQLGAQGGFTPQVMFGGLADRADARRSLQLGFIESDQKMYDQLSTILTGGGAGSERMHEAGYLDALVFLSRMTDIQCFSEQGRKGHAILVGDELPNGSISVADVKALFGLDVTHPISIEQAIEDVRERWHLTFIFARTNAYGAAGATQVLARWQELIGPENVLEVDGVATGLAHLMAARIGTLEGLMTPVSAVEHLVAIGTDMTAVLAVARAFHVEGQTTAVADPEDGGFQRV